MESIKGETGTFPFYLAYRLGYTSSWNKIKFRDKRGIKNEKRCFIKRIKAL